MMTKKKDDLNSLENKLLKEISGAGFTVADVKEFITGLQKRKTNFNTPYKVGKEHLKIGVFGDNHIGNIAYDPQLMKLFSKETKKEKVDFVINVGDIVDGWYQNRPSSIFEQNAIGFDNQLKMAVNEFSQLEVPIYFITGNHTYNTFVRGAGVEFGPIFESRLKDKGLEAHYLGNAEGDIEFGKGSIMRLLHPDGGTAYAISYKSQKIVESFEGGHKPNMLFIGHFHKAEYIFYRNVHVMQTGTLCGQTKFMKGKGIAAHKGFWIVDIYGGGKGDVDSITPRFYPAYD